MTLAAALTQLATWTVTGVTTHYAYSAMPVVIPEVALPALVVDIGDSYDAFRALNINYDIGLASVVVDHYLLVRGIGMGLDSDRLSVYVTAIDNYLAAVANDFDLAGTLAEPLMLGAIRAVPLEWGGVLYRAVHFPHVWKIEVT